MAPIPTAVVGAGLASHVFHIPLILSLPELFKLSVVVQRRPDGTIEKIPGAEGVKVATSYDDVLSDPEIRLIVLGTPNTTHYPFAKAALEAGKHVLVDKPVTPTFKEASDLLHIAKSRGLVLYAFQNRRWDSDYLTLLRLIKAGTLGDIVEFESHFDRYRTTLRENWREKSEPGAGLMYDLGSHLIDQALQILGAPSRVTAFSQNIRGLGDADVDDNFTIHLHYDRKPHPATAILRAHILSVRSPQIRYQIRGLKGSYIKYGLDIQEDQLKAGRRPGADDTAFGVEPQDIHGELHELNADGSVSTSRVPSETGTYQSLFQNLAAAINAGAPLDVKWEEAAAVIQIIELAHQSSKERRTIDVPPM